MTLGVCIDYIVDALTYIDIYIYIYIYQREGGRGEGEKKRYRWALGVYTA